MTKIDIISGFLGAGKTTLIKKLLAEAYPGEKLVLIENEFGEISIDGGFLKDSGVQISEMSSGCICCSLVGDFTQALQDVYSQFHPDRILIEPSGVGKLSDVVAAVERTAAQVPELKLNCFTAVADAGKVKSYLKNFGEFYEDQIRTAGAVILSRTQNLTRDKLDGAVALLRGLNPKAAILTTPWDELDGQTILKAMERASSLEEELLAQLMARKAQEEHEHEHHHHHDHEHEHHHDHEHEHHHDHGHEGHHHADEVFASWGRETAHTFTAQQLDGILAALDSGAYGQVLRAKGILPCADGGWLHFDYVPEEHQVRTGPADFTGRLCVIGARLDEEGLSRLFAL